MPIMFGLGAIPGVLAHMFGPTFTEGAEGAGGGGGGTAGGGDPSGTAGDGSDGGKAKAGDGSADLGDAGKKALDTEREARRAAEKRATEAEGKLKQHEDAKLSETERIAKQLAETERDRTNLQREVQEARTDRAIERAASKAGFIDPEDAVLAISRASLKLEDDGTPTKDSLEKALKSLAEAKPHLVGGDGKGSWDGGARKSAPGGPDMNQLIREAAGRA